MTEELNNVNKDNFALQKDIHIYNNNNNNTTVKRTKTSKFRGLDLSSYQNSLYKTWDAIVNRNENKEITNLKILAEYDLYYQNSILALKPFPRLLRQFFIFESKYLFSGLFWVILTIFTNTFKLNNKNAVPLFMAGISGSGKGMVSTLIKSHNSFRRIDRITNRGFDKALVKDKNFFKGIHVYLDATTTLGTQNKSVQQMILNFYNMKVDDPDFIEYSFISKNTDANAYKGKTSFIICITKDYLDELKKDKNIRHSTIFDRSPVCYIKITPEIQDLRKRYKKYLKHKNLWDGDLGIKFEFGEKRDIIVDFIYSKEIEAIGKSIFLGKNLILDTTTDRSDEQATQLVQSIASLEGRDSVQQIDIELMKYLSTYLKSNEDLLGKIFDEILTNKELTIYQIIKTFYPGFENIKEEKRKKEIYQKFYRLLKTLENSGFIRSTNLEEREHKKIYYIGDKK